jgi:hypothetical protein
LCGAEARHPFGTVIYNFDLPRSAVCFPDPYTATAVLHGRPKKRIGAEKCGGSMRVVPPASFHLHMTFCLDIRMEIVSPAKGGAIGFLVADFLLVRASVHAAKKQ